MFSIWQNCFFPKKSIFRLIFSKGRGIRKWILILFSMGVSDHSFSQTLDDRFIKLDSLMTETKLKISLLEKTKDSLENQRKILVREKSLIDINTKYNIAIVGSDKTPLMESIYDVKIVSSLSKGQEIEILGAKENYLFVRKDDLYGYVSPIFLNRDNQEINDFINGLIEEDNFQNEILTKKIIFFVTKTKT